MQAKLVGVDGAFRDTELPLEEDGSVLIGRREGCDLILSSEKVSRTHCRLKFSDGFWVVEDLDSTNGTWVNEQRRPRAMLFHGDTVRVGEDTFRFELIPTTESDEYGLELRDEESPAHYATEIKEKIDGDASSVILETSTGEGTDTEKLKELERDLGIIYEVIQEVNSQDELNSVLETIADYSLSVTDADRVYLMVGKKPGGLVMPSVSRYSEYVPPELRGSFSRTVIWECYKDGCSVLKTDPRRRNTAPSRSICTQRISSIICVPIRCEVGILGIIYGDTITETRKFQKRHLKLLSAIANQVGYRIRRAQLARQVESLFNDAIQTLTRVLESKDEYTMGHSERVTALALKLGEAIDLDPTQMRDLRLAGLLHDIGKVGIPSTTLKKPGRLTDAEYLSVQHHVIAGAEIVASIEHAERITEAVRHHHERWDGMGYPDGLKGEETPLLARVLAVADAFDAMASSRPYRDELTPERIVEEFRQGVGTQFDPQLAKQFLKLFPDDDAFMARLDQIYEKRVNRRPTPSAY